MTKCKLSRLLPALHKFFGGGGELFDYEGQFRCEGRRTFHRQQFLLLLSIYLSHKNETQALRRPCSNHTTSPILSHHVVSHPSRFYLRPIFRQRASGGRSAALFTSCESSSLAIGDANVDRPLFHWEFYERVTNKDPRYY